MKHKLINFEGIVNKLIVNNLLINYLILKKQLLTAVLQLFLKNQKQSLANVLQNGCSQKFRNIQRKTSVWSLLSIKLQACLQLNFSVNIAKFFRNSFFHGRPPMAASEKFINFLGKNQWRRRSGFIFLINTTK